MCSDDDGIYGELPDVQRRTDRQRKRQKLLSLRLRQERKLPQRQKMRRQCFQAAKTRRAQERRQRVNTLRLSGTVVSMENGELTMNRQVGDSTEEVIITISDDTKILDGVNGYPVEADTLTEGKAVNVYVGPAMTMSLPPIANGIMIITDVPEDAAFPKYTQVESLDQGSADGEFVLTTVDGSEYTITAETRLLPYLTKNIVSEEDLTEGTDILVWTSADDAAKTEKIVIFQSGN